MRSSPAIGASSFRIGINLGDVVADGEDIFGDGVNIAARLEALAEPGGICVSRVVRDQIRDKLPYPFDDMGNRASRTSRGRCAPTRWARLLPRCLGGPMSDYPGFIGGSSSAGSMPSS
jgi:class 3 adenylate cyclase